MPSGISRQVARRNFAAKEKALALPHTRLRLDATHTVMAGYGWPFSLIGPSHQLVFGRPFHAVAELGVDA